MKAVKNKDPKKLYVVAAVVIICVAAAFGYLMTQKPQQAKTQPAAVNNAAPRKSIEQKEAEMKELEQSLGVNKKSEEEQKAMFKKIKLKKSEMTTDMDHQ